MASTDESKREWSEYGDNARLEFTTDKRIRTEKDALEFGEVDTSVWFVKRMKMGSYEVTLKPKHRVEGPDGEIIAVDRVVRKTMWRVILELERIAPKPILDGLQAFYDRIAAVPRDYRRPPVKVPKRGDERFLLELGLYDVHFGKLCWGKETGTDYDLKIAEQLYARAAETLLHRAFGYADKIDRFLIVVGNDYFHFDNLESGTTRGTRVDSDGRYAKVFECGLEAHDSLVETLLGHAPVDMIWIPGNHDHLASYNLAQTIKARHRGNSDVRVDVTPKVRKYYEYGVSLLGFDHGDSAPQRTLPGLMMQEAAAHIRPGQCREFHRGHVHIRRKARLVSDMDDCEGLVIRTLPSLSGHDFWHFRHGYAGYRAAESYLYEAESGFAANFSVSADSLARI